jgi:signal recognition particle GTPase
MPDNATTETVELLREIRDLLVPVADAYRDQYEERQAEREAQRLASIQALVASSDKRNKAWKLADGSRSQRTIAKESGMSEGNVSRLFKDLRELGAVSESTSPQRLVEV